MYPYAFIHFHFLCFFLFRVQKVDFPLPPLFYSLIVPLGFLPSEILVAFRWESQLRQSGATQPTVHAGCFSVSIIHRNLTWTIGSLTCAQTLMHAIAHGVVRAP